MNCCRPRSVSRVTRVRSVVALPSGKATVSRCTETMRPVMARAPPTVTCAPFSVDRRSAGEASESWSNGRSLKAWASGSRPGRLSPPTPPLSS